MTHEQKLAAAKKRVLAMDKVDGGDRSIGTIITALDVGLGREPNDDAAYDALFMLKDIYEVAKFRGINLVNLKDLLTMVRDAADE